MGGVLCGLIVGAGATPSPSSAWLRSGTTGNRHLLLRCTPRPVAILRLRHGAFGSVPETVRVKSLYALHGDQSDLPMTITVETLADRHQQALPHTREGRHFIAQEQARAEGGAPETAVSTSMPLQRAGWAPVAENTRFSRPPASATALKSRTTALNAPPAAAKTSKPLRTFAPLIVAVIDRWPEAVQRSSAKCRRTV